MAWVGAKVDSLGLAGALVLEVGSYNMNGSVRELFHPERYVGVDVVDGPGVDQVVGSRETLPFLRESFDVVVSTECLEHAEAPWRTVKEMARVARRGAPVLVTARGWRCTNFETGEVICFGFHNPPDRWRFSGEAMEALAVDAGLTVVEVVPDPQVAGWFLHAERP